ncbi:MAG: hypothetical protein C5B52_16520 [Bacteroidetes bacterium]|nr:MAG: hypothetical protein C5B52_16520 [Bacteroidota bacterium]
MTRKFKAPVALMIAAMLLIVAFQGYWLSLNYRDEKRNLHFRTNIIFRETVFHLQASKLNLDTSLHIKFKTTNDIARFTDVVRERVTDSAAQPEDPGEAKSIITYERDDRAGTPDSLKDKRKRLDGKFFDFIVSIDSLQDSIRINELVVGFQQNLMKEKINAPFTITRKIASTPRMIEDGPRPEWNKITIGFRNPITYELAIEDAWPYLLRQIFPQIIFSIFLIGLTILAFLVLYRNLIAQRKLTEIKNEFISNITHELKTPIATVSVAIEAMKNFNALQNPERTEEYLDIAGNELSRLSLLVDKVLKLSMFEMKQTELKFEWFDMRTLVEEVVNSMRLQIDKYNAGIHLHIPMKELMVQGDRLHLTSVIYNLLDNALKYGSGNPRIDIYIDRDDSNLILKVKDNGIGIPAEYKSRIFEKFFRVPTGNKHNVKGYGLGLSYTAHIVRQHSGEIEVAGEAGEGTEFTIKIPVSHEESQDIIRGR